MPKTPLFYGWYIVAACFLLCFLFAGTGFYSFSVFIEPIEAEFGWNRAAISLTMSIYLITGGLMGPALGKLIDLFGPKKVMNACAMGAGACFLLASQTRWLWYFYLIYAFLAMSVCGMGVISVSNLLSNWFDRRRGTAIGIAMVGISAGGMLLVPLVGLITQHYGWKTAFVVIGIMVWSIALPAINLIIKDRPADIGLLPDGQGAPCAAAEGGDCSGSPGLAGWPAPMVLRSRSFWCIFLSFFLAPLAQMGVLQHQVPLLVDLGATPAAAAAALGLTAGVGGLGKLSFGRFSETWPFHYVVLGSFGGQAAAVLLLLNSPSAAMVWVYAVLFGFSMGGVIVLLPLVVGHFWGLLSYGVLLGVLWIANCLGGAAGTYLSGFIYDLLGDYRVALYIFVAAYGISITSFFLAGPAEPYPEMDKALDATMASSAESV